MNLPKTCSNIGVIGYGYWGPNIVRNFHGQERSRVVTVCDKNAKSLTARAAGVSRYTNHQRLRGIADFAGNRCRGRGHTGVDAFRAGQDGSGERQACIRREALHLHHGTSARN